LMIGYLNVEDKLPQSIKNRVRDFLGTGNFYRGDTENHLTMYYMGLYLAAQTFPDLPAHKWYTGKSSQENMEEAMGWFDEWMKLTTTIGQGEFDSPTYMPVFIAPMFGLYQWAKDPVLKQNALVMIHWLLADFAVEHLEGIYVGAHSRDYPDRVIRPRHESSDMVAWGWYLFGKGSPRFHYTLLAVNNGLRILDIHALLIDPNNKNTVYAGTLNDGLWLSENGGKNWKFIGLETSQVWDMVIVDF